MVTGNKRSRTFRRVAVKTPGSKSVIHYKLRAHSKPHCGSCGKLLAGVASGRPSQLNKLSKTQKRPERPFGGVLCGECMRREMKARARGTA